MYFFFFKRKTAYEMRISDWSSDVCSSDLGLARRPFVQAGKTAALDQRTLAALRESFQVHARRKRAARTGQDADADVVAAVQLIQCRGHGLGGFQGIGRASCRESVCQYV